MNEERGLLLAVEQLSFYLRRYASYEQATTLPQTKSAHNHFKQSFQRVFEDCFLQMAGLCDAHIVRVPSRVRQAFVDTTAAVARNGMPPRIEILSQDDDHVAVMPPKMGAFQLGECLSIIASSTTACEAERRLSDLAVPDALRRTFVNAVNQLYGWLSLDDPAYMSVAKLKCLVRACPASSLYRTLLYPRIDEAESYGSVGSLISETIRDVAPQLADWGSETWDLSNWARRRWDSVKVRRDGLVIVNGECVKLTNLPMILREKLCFDQEEIFKNVAHRSEAMNA